MVWHAAHAEGKRGREPVRYVRYLEQYRIGIRWLFAGNLPRQPYFANRHFRKVGALPNTDRVMRDTLRIGGVYPGLNEEQLTFASRKLTEYLGLCW